MSTTHRSHRNKRRGVLTFEWILLITVLVIGIVGGASAVRDAMISELGDVAEAAVAVDQSYSVETVTVTHGTETITLGQPFAFPDEDFPLSETRKTGGPTQASPVGDCGPSVER